MQASPGETQVAGYRIYCSASEGNVEMQGVDVPDYRYM